MTAKIAKDNKIWEIIAEDYSKFKEKTKFSILYPALLSLFNTYEKKNVLDIGCGDGSFAYMLAAKGANVIAVDTSAEMIKIAKSSLHKYWPSKTNDSVEFRYIKEKYKLDDIFGNETFDIAFSNLVLMLFPQKEKIRKLFLEVRNVLKEDGFFIISVTHPCFREKDFSTFRNYFPTDFNYFESGQPYTVELIGGKGRDILFTDYHWLVQDYVKVFIDEGFSLEIFEEPQPHKCDSFRDSVSPQETECFFPPFLIVGGKRK